MWLGPCHLLLRPIQLQLLLPTAVVFWFLVGFLAVGQGKVGLPVLQQLQVSHTIQWLVQKVHSRLLLFGRPQLKVSFLA